MTKLTWELVVMSDLVKIGVQEEEGYDIIRERWYVVAESLEGHRFSHGWMFETPAEADERMGQIARDGGVDPVRSNWYEMYPAYGSPAYQEKEPEIVAEERRRDMEDQGRIVGMRYGR